MCAKQLPEEFDIGSVQKVSISARMESAFLDYAMSVIVGRALPDVRDGFKPVHRRILYAMFEVNNDWNKPYKKSARIVGDVLGKFHPHGQEAVYESLVRMAQEFTMRYPLVDGQGNFGSIDGDNPAAMRYTEVRMSKIAHQMLSAIDKETVDFVPNYDGAEFEPSVLPSLLPNLLVNGSAGIAVGMATKIPPHNLQEVLDACLHYIVNPNCPIEDLVKFIPCPDFPTGAQIIKHPDMQQAYLTGKGRVMMRAKSHIEQVDKAREAIILDELPYQVNKANLIIKIADLVREKRIEGINDLRDESDRHGIRVVIELKRNEHSDIILNKLHKYTEMQTSFPISFVALSNGVPQVMNLKQIIGHFIDHRREVTVRQTNFELAKARNRAHILEGLTVALDNVDLMIKIIRDANTPAIAKLELLEQQWNSDQVIKLITDAVSSQSSDQADTDTDKDSKNAASQLTKIEGQSDNYGLQIKDSGRSKSGHFYRLSPEQAQAILDMRLARLTGLEREKLVKEYQELLQQIKDYLALLASPVKIDKHIINSFKELGKQFADPRRTQIIEDELEFDDEALIPDEEMVVTLSHKGYVKRQKLSDYQAQKRGGQGKMLTKARDDDFISKMYTATSHQYLLVFTNRGRIYWLKVYQIPMISRTARGRPIVNLLPLMEHEEVRAVLPVRKFDDDHFVFFTTKNGMVKKTPLKAFARPMKKGIIAINLVQDDDLVRAALTTGKENIMIFTNVGKACRFSEEKTRSMGRAARGVKGIKLDAGQRVVSMQATSDESMNFLTVSANGYGKQTSVGKIAVKGRSGKGMIAMKVTEKTGEVIGTTWAKPDDEIMLVSNTGKTVRVKVSQIRKTGRAASGVKIMSLTSAATDDSADDVAANAANAAEDVDAHRIVSVARVKGDSKEISGVDESVQGQIDLAPTTDTADTE